jgi:hypothetical protein
VKSYWIIIVLGFILFLFYRQVGLAFMIMGVILWMIARRRASRQPASEENACPQCGQPVRVGLSVCSACGLKLLETERGRACDLCGKVYENFYPNEEGKYYCHKCARTMASVTVKK